MFFTSYSALLLSTLMASPPPEGEICSFICQNDASKFPPNFSSVSNTWAWKCQQEQQKHFDLLSSNLKFCTQREVAFPPQFLVGPRLPQFSQTEPHPHLMSCFQYLVKVIKKTLKSELWREEQKEDNNVPLVGLSLSSGGSLSYTNSYFF